MPGTQLSCPHCGAMLNFNQPIPAGAAVRCLICNRVLALNAAAVAPKPAGPPPMPVAPPTVPVQGPPPSGAPGVDPQRVEDAVARGVRYLRARQKPDGDWDYFGTSVGCTALTGLTLLECKVPAN